MSSTPVATACTGPVWPVSGFPTGVPSASRPYPHCAVAAAADNDRGTVWQHPSRHRVHGAGVASEDGKTVGDVAAEVYERDDLMLTPTKGGVGPLTVCALFENVIRAARRAAE